MSGGKIIARGVLPEGQVKTRKTLKERQQELMNDPWADGQTEWNVRCRGCDQTLLLDQRRPWNLYPWYKHRHSCPGIPDPQGRDGDEKVRLSFHRYWGVSR
jgi:hypothetical protein